MARAVFPLMQAQGGGRICNVVGAAARNPTPAYLTGGAANAVGLHRAHPTQSKDPTGPNCVANWSIADEEVTIPNPQRVGYSKRECVLLPFHIADDMHNLGYIHFRAPLIDDRQRRIQTLGERPGALHPARVWRNYR